MNLNQKEKDILLQALRVEAARIKRAANAEPLQEIKEILGKQYAEINLLATRVANEVPK